MHRALLWLILQSQIGEILESFFIPSPFLHFHLSAGHHPVGPSFSGVWVESMRKNHGFKFPPDSSWGSGVGGGRMLFGAPKTGFIV